MIQITIPIHPHLKKFLLHRYDSATGRIDVTTKRSYGIDLMKVLTKNSRIREKTNLSKYTDSITLNISEYYTSRAGFYISSENIEQFNAKIKFDFEESLYDHLMILLKTRKDTIIEEEILIYLSYYDINESMLELDSLKKDFYRWRKNRNLQIFR